MVPLHKGQCTLELSNYRPISLLLTISKLLEKVMYTWVYDFLSNTHQIYESQYVFQAKHSCEHAIGELVSEITKNIELGKQTVSAFLDLSFDTLEHSVIFTKFERYGLCGPCLEWFKSYLYGRTLRVRCNTGNGIGLSREHVAYGTPQGSCLGPLIFLVFCNDLHLYLMYLEVLHFTDDTTLYLSHKHIGYIRFCFETDLANIQDWFSANKLTLNINKSVLMHFNSKEIKEPLNVKIGGIRLLVVKNTKFLGVYIDKNLNWNEHTKHLQLKLKARSCLLGRGKNLLSSHAKKMVYFAQIHSNSLYGILMWGNMIQKSDLNKLQKLQNRCVQYIHLNMPIKGMYKNLGILNINEMLKLKNCKLWYKFYKGLLPIKLQKIMSVGSSQETLLKSHNYNTHRKRELNSSRASSLATGNHS